MRFIIILMIFFQIIFAQNISKEIANICTTPLYNLDDEQAKNILTPFIKDHKNIKAIEIIDSTDNSIFLSVYRDNNNLIFKTIPNSIKILPSSTTNITKNNEIIGKVKVFYTDNNILNEKEKKWIKTHIVTIGVEQWAPVVFSNNGHDIDGIAGDFTKLIIKKTGLKTTIINDKWNKLLDDFKKKKIDILPATFYTKERATYGLYSKPYFSMKNFLYVKKENNTIHSFNDLNGKKLAIIKGYGTIDSVKEKYPNIKLILTKDLDDSINKVLNGKVDALYDGQAAVEKKITDELIKGLKPIAQNSFPADKLYYFINPEKPILKNIIEKALNHITDEERGAIISKWLSGNTQIKLSNIEIAWLDKNIELKYIFDPNKKPIEWADELKEHKGIIADIIRLIEQKSSIKIEPIYSKNLKEAFQKIKDKKANSFSSAKIYDNLNINYTKHSILKIPIVVVSNIKNKIKNLSSISKKRVGIISNSDAMYIIKKRYPNQNYISISDKKIAFEMLKNNQIDYLICNAISAKYFISFLGYYKDLQIIYKTNMNINIKFAISKDLGNIPLSIIDKSIKNITEKELNDIIDKWTNVRIRTHTNWKLILEIIGVLILIIIFMLWNSSKLNQMVKEKTKDIELQKEELEKLSQSLELKVKEKTKKLASEKKLIDSIINSQESIVVTSDGTKLTTINNAFKKFYSLETIEEFVQKYGYCICDSFEEEVPEGYIKKYIDGVLWVDYILSNPNKQHKVIIKKENQPYIFSISLDSFIFENQKFVTIVLNDITEIEHAKEHIEKIHKHTRESIEFASLLQGALIPEDKLFKEIFKSHFVLWQPKDIVGGDIYLFELLRHKDEALLMVIDCTGHGVPGAFVTMIVKAVEREIISILKENDENEISPAWILSYFNKTIKKLLRQECEDSLSNAGFDGGIIYYNKKEQILKFAGAQTPLFYIDDNKQLNTIKGDRYSVGYKKCDINYQYKEHIIKVQEGMKFYITTDGYLDQNGGPKGFPFGKKRFKQIIKEFGSFNMLEQKDIFAIKLNEWENYGGISNERNDDMTVIGFEIDKKSDTFEEIEIIKYEGILSQNLIATTIDNIEAQILEIGISSKIATITIEILQNMMNYAKNDKVNDFSIYSHGSIEIKQISPLGFEISSKNIISIQDKEKIEPTINEIKTLDKNGIKKRYRELRKSGENTHSKGGGIGFYEIAKLASNIDFEFHKINEDKYYFLQKITIYKKG